MSLADEGMAMETAGVTSAITVDNARSMAHRGIRRGKRYSKTPTKMAMCRRCGKMTPHNTHPNGSAKNCLTCKQHEDLARGAERQRKFIAARQVPGSDAYWKSREMAWKQQGIRIEGDGFLDRTVYQAVLDFQRNHCAVCGLDFGISGQLPCAEHDHATGTFRGVVCGGKRGCNIWAIARIENGHGIKVTKTVTAEHVAHTNYAVKAYLDDTPYRRWLRSLKR